MNMLAQWEDGENHRQTQFSVEYSIENSCVTIDRITPNKVTFTCPATNTAVRTVGVHTNKGQALLSEQFLQSGKLEELIKQIGRKCGLLVLSE